MLEPVVATGIILADIPLELFFRELNKTMSDPGKKQMRRGIISSVVAALCCFSPLLVVLLGVVGLSSWLGWIDYVLFPAMFASLGVVAHASYIRSGKTGPQPVIIIFLLVAALSGLLFWLEFRFALRISIAAMAAVFLYGFYLRRACATDSGQAGAPSCSHSAADPELHTEKQI